MRDDLLEVEVTCPDTDSAREIARAAVDARLAACGNIIGGVESVYRWQGAVESAPEVLLRLKARDGVFDALAALIVQRHPYDQPAIVALSVRAAGPGTEEWLRSETERD